MDRLRVRLNKCLIVLVTFVWTGRCFFRCGPALTSFGLFILKLYFFIRFVPFNVVLHKILDE